MKPSESDSADDSDDDASVFTCRHQWKARRAEIEYLAREAERKSNKATVRSHRATYATLPQAQTAALQMQDEVLKRLRQQCDEDEKEKSPFAYDFLKEFRKCIDRTTCEEVEQGFCVDDENIVTPKYKIKSKYF